MPAHRQLALIPLLLMLLALGPLDAEAATITSAGSGNWTAGGTWVGGVPPGAVDTAVIANGHSVTLNTSTTITNLQVGTTGATTTRLRFGDTDGITSNYTLTVRNDVTLVTRGRIEHRNSEGGQHLLQIGGNLSNSGTGTNGMNMWISSTRNIAIEFNDDATLTNATISGTGDYDLAAVTVNKGSSTATITENSTTFWALGSSTLTFTRGIFIHNNATTWDMTLAQQQTVITIGANATIEVPLGAVTAYVGFLGDRLEILGELKINGGAVTIGDATDERIWYGPGSKFTISSGSLNCASEFRPTAAVSTITWNQTNGAVTLMTAGSTSGTDSGLDIAAAGSSFTMSNGSIVMQQPTLTADDVVLTPGTANITGGTLQFGNASTANASIFAINATARLNDLTINGDQAGATDPELFLDVNNLAVGNDLTIAAACTLDSNGLDIALGRNWTNNGTFLQGTRTVTLDGSVAQVVGGTSATTFNNLTISNTSGASPSITYSGTPATLTVNGTFLVSAANVLSAVGKTIDTKGTVTFDATFTQSSGTFQFSGASQTMGGAAATGPAFADLVVTGGTTTLSAADDIDMSVDGTFNITGTGALTCGDANNITIVTGTWDNDGTFTYGPAASQLVTFSGAGTYRGAVNTTFQNVTFTGGVTTMDATDDTDMTVDTTLSIAAVVGSALACGDLNDVTIATGTWDNDGTFTHGAAASQLVTFSGACTYSGASATTFQNVTFTGGATTMSAADDTDMTVDTTLSIAVAVGSALTCGDLNDITIATGTWDNDGTFTHGAAATQLVTFSGACTYSGASATTFQNVTFTGGTTTMDATDDTDMTVDTTLSITGTGGLTCGDLNDITIATGTWDNDGTFTHGANAAQLVTFGSGANTYSGAATTTFQNVTFTTGTTTMDATDDTDMTVDTTLTVTVSGGLSCGDANDITIASGTWDMRNTFTHGPAATQTVTFSGAGTYKGTANTTFQNVTFTGGATTMDATDDTDMTVDETLNITGTGTLTCGDANDIALATGTWDNDGTFTHGANAAQLVTFGSGANTYRGSVNTTFQNVTFSTGTTTMDAVDGTDMTVDETLTVSASGGLSCGDANDITIAAGTWDMRNTFSHGANLAQTVTFSGACTYKGTANTTFQNVTFTGGGTTMDATDDTDMTVDETLNITGTGTLTCGDANNVTIATGTWDNDGTFTHGANATQLVTFGSGANTYRGSVNTTFQNVTFSTGTTTMDAVDGTDMTVDETLTVSASGGLACGDANDLTIASGTWDVRNTFTHGANATQTVTFSGACTYKGTANTTFQNVTFTGGTTTMDATDDTDMTVDTTLNIAGTGTLTCGDANDVTIATGTWDNDGTFSYGGNTTQRVTFSGACTYRGLVSTSFRNVTIANGTTTMDATDDTDMSVDRQLLIATAATSGTLAPADANTITIATTGTLEMNGTSAASAPTLLLVPTSNVVVNGTFLTTWAGGANLKAAIDGTVAGAVNFDLLGATVDVTGLTFTDGDADGLTIGKNGGTDSTVANFEAVDFSGMSAGGRHLTYIASAGQSMVAIGCTFTAILGAGANVRCDESPNAAGDTVAILIRGTGAGSGEGGPDDDTDGGPSGAASRDGYVDWAAGGDRLTRSPGTGEVATDPSTYTGGQGFMNPHYNWFSGAFVANFVLVRSDEDAVAPFGPGAEEDLLWALNGDGTKKYATPYRVPRTRGRVLGPPWTVTIGAAGPGTDVVCFITTLGYIHVVRDTGAALADYGPYPVRARDSITYATEVCDAASSPLLYYTGSDYVAETTTDGEEGFFFCGANTGSNQVYFVKAFTAGEEGQCQSGWPFGYGAQASRSWPSLQFLGGTTYLHIATDNDVDPDDGVAANTGHIFRVNVSTGAVDQEYAPASPPGNHVRGGLQMLDDPAVPDDARLYAASYEDAVTAGNEPSLFGIVTDSAGPGTYVDVWAPNNLGTDHVDMMPTFGSTHLYVGDLGGTVYAVNRLTGATAGSRTLDAGQPIRGTPIFPTISSSTMWVATDNGKIYRIDGADFTAPALEDVAAPIRIGDGRKVRVLGFSADGAADRISVITSDGYILTFAP